ncbi:DUF4167 domain-containing protein [Sphingobium aromaticiconvertens]|uniref:DUF4167 domain-containing protein n=1 Tax=Sphingobium aromaticiconvertens TaxID=365341 RepID=UPI003018DEAB
MINNRQAGRRNRGRNNNGRPNGGGNRGGGDNGNRIDNRARGNATQLLEKYRNMARDAQLSGDRVNAEYYLQFADHYFRVLADNRARQEEQQGQSGQPQQGQNRFRRNDEALDDYSDDFDGNDENGDDFRFSQPERAERQEQRSERQPRQERQERPERQDRGDRQPQFQQSQGEGQGQPQGQGQDGEGRPRRDRNRRDRINEPREQRAVEPVAEQAPQVELPVAAPVAPTVQQAPAQEEAPAPRRRGRPRKSDTVKSEAAEAEPQGLDIAVLPPSIARADNDSEPTEEAPRKRTRRARPTTEAAE